MEITESVPETEVIAHIDINKDEINSPEDALAALLSLKDEYKIDNFSYNATEEEINSNIENCYFMQQLYNNIPVEDGFFRVYTTKEGIFSSVEGRYVDVDLENTMSNITAKRAVSASRLKSVTKAELMIHSANSEAILVWKVTNKKEQYTYIDAMDASIVGRGSNIMY